MPFIKKHGILIILGVIIIILVGLVTKFNNKNIQLLTELTVKNSIIEKIISEKDSLKAVIATLFQKNNVKDTLKITTQNVVKKENKIKKDPSFEEQYENSLKLFNIGSFTKATKEFTRLIQAYPDSKLLKNLYYWLGLSYYSLENFDLAHKNFLISLKTKGYRNKSADATFMLGKTLYQMNKFADSFEYFAKYNKKFNNNRYNKSAKFYMEMLLKDKKIGKNKKKNS